MKVRRNKIIKNENLLSKLVVNLSVVVTSSTAVNYAYSHHNNLKVTEIDKNFSFDGKNKYNTKVDELPFREIKCDCWSNAFKGNLNIKRNVLAGRGYIIYLNYFNGFTK